MGHFGYRVGPISNEFCMQLQTMVTKIPAQDPSVDICLLTGPFCKLPDFVCYIWYTGGPFKMLTPFDSEFLCSFQIIITHYYFNICLE